MVAEILWIQVPFNFYMNAILTYKLVPKYLKPSHFYRIYYPLLVVIFHVFSSQDIIKVCSDFSGLSIRPLHLVANIKRSAVFIMCMPSHITTYHRRTSWAQTKPRCTPFKFHTHSACLQFLMALSNTKLKNDGDKLFFFRPFLKEYVYHKWWPTNVTIPFI
jgi:hypothetical protein